MTAPVCHSKFDTAIALERYRAFLRSKIVMAESAGFEIDPGEINPNLKDFMRQAIVPWMAAGGRRALFSKFGLHKTSAQLEIARLAMKHTGVAALQIVPLGVRQEFFEEASLRFTGDHAVKLHFIRRMSEVDERSINITNYETAREGHIDPRAFGLVNLDEAACLRGFGGTKTFREFMALFAGDDRKAGIKTDGVRFRYVATATPDPNEFIELLAYAAFLGIMDVGQAKTRFFKRDSEHADRLTIHPHKEREFWLWVASWALFLNKPSDLGFSDDGYDRPALDVRWHEVPSDHRAAGEERDGQVRMFKNAAYGVSDAAKEKRSTISSRIGKLSKIIDEARRSQLREGLSPEAPGETSRSEQAALPGEQGRLQSPHKKMAGEQPRACERIGAQLPEGQSGEIESGRIALVSQKPGESAGDEIQARVRHHAGALRDDSEGAERVLHDLSRSPDTANALASGSLPQVQEGAGPALPQMQRGIGVVQGQSGSAATRDGLSDQLVIWCDLNDEQRAIERALKAAGVSYASLYGNQDIEEREDLMRAWKRVGTTALITKPQMYGAGVNLQQCHTMVFIGIGHKFHDFVQSLHRCERFGQKHRVTVHLIYSEAERDVRRNLEAKWKRHEDQAAIMAGIIREFGLSQAALASTLQRSFGVQRQEIAGENYRLINNDCVEEAHALETGSVHLIVTSIPFSTQYEYTPSYNDFGHTDDDDHFWEQMDFLTPQLLRALQPGRVAAIHVKDRIVPGGINGLGFQTVSPFSDQCVAHFRKHGFAYLARKTIVTDVVRENNQTYRLGWTEQCKDGSRMGAGMPEYLLLFRKPPSDASNGYADVPVVKDKREWKRDHWTNDGYSRARWQVDAHGFQRSSGNRLLSGEELIGLPADVIYKTFRQFSAESVYDFERHVRIAETLESKGQLPPTFMLLPPASWHPDVWSDVTRMRTLNGAQHAKGREMHLCPLQFDIVDRAIAQFTMPGETVFDPFGGLMTVPYRAVLQKRRGIGIELSTAYFRDGAVYCEAAERQMAMPTLFDILATQDEAQAIPEAVE